MKKNLIQLFTSLLIVLLAVSFFGTFSVPVTGQTAPAPSPVAETTSPPPLVPEQIVAQDKAMDFMVYMLPVDLSKYTVTLRSNSIMYGVPLADDNRIIINILYKLTSPDSDLEIGFAFEKGLMTSCGVNPLRGQIILNRQYDNSLVAAKDFFERYQVYTQFDSSNLIAMLDNVDVTKNSTVTSENIKFTVDRYNFGGDKVGFEWRSVVNGVESLSMVSFIFDMDGNFRRFVDSRLLYTFGDMSVKVSMERAIDIALENLKYYSYDMSDGVVVKDFRVSRENVVATLVTASVDYELRPYWDIRMALDEVYPGNVHGITVFIWANTGEVISYSNMAFGGVTYSDTYNPPSSELTSPSNYTLLVVAAVVIVAAVAVITFVLVTKKRHK